MVSRIVSPFQKILNSFCPEPHQRNPYLWQLQIYEMYFLNNNVTETKLTLLTVQWAVNQETTCWGKDYDFIWKLADQEDGRLLSQNDHLIGVWGANVFL